MPNVRFQYYYTLIHPNNPPKQNKKKKDLLRKRDLNRNVFKNGKKKTS